jgi:GNAT superfamily N-acetyltransferase
MESPAVWPPPLTSYVTQRLQCAPEALTEPGVHFVVARERRLRVWRYVIPLWLMVFDRAAVVSSAPELAPSVEELLRAATLDDLLTEGTKATLERVIVESGPREWFRRALWLCCTREMFAPRAAAKVLPVPPDHPEGRALRERHRGEVFGVFRGRELISRSSIKTESDVAWEVAVATAERHRRRGLGASVVSRATEFILDHGRLALYHCEDTNEASRRLAESLGYRVFARELAWSVDAMWVPWFWEGAPSS